MEAGLNGWLVVYHSPSLVHTQPWAAKSHPSPHVSCHLSHPCGPGPQPTPQSPTPDPTTEKKEQPIAEEMEGHPPDLS